MTLLVSLLFAQVSVSFVTFFIVQWNEAERNKGVRVRYEQERMEVWAKGAFAIMLVINLYWWGWTYYHWSFPPWYAHTYFVFKVFTIGIVFQFLLRFIIGRLSGFWGTQRTYKLPSDWDRQDDLLKVLTAIAFYGFVDLPRRVHVTKARLWFVFAITFYLTVYLTYHLHSYLWIYIFIVSYCGPEFLPTEIEADVLEMLGPTGREKVLVARMEWEELVKRAEDRVRQRRRKEFKPSYVPWDDAEELKQTRLISLEVAYDNWYNVYRIEEWRRYTKVEGIIGHFKHDRRLVNDPVYRRQFAHQQWYIARYYAKYPFREYGSTLQDYKDSPKRRDLDGNFKWWPYRMKGQHQDLRRYLIFRKKPPRFYPRSVDHRTRWEKFRDWILWYASNIYRSYTRVITVWVGKDAHKNPYMNW